MTLCPIAMAVGCKKCPAFKVCPVKSLIGDVPKAGSAEAQRPAASKENAKKPDTKRPDTKKPAAKKPASRKK